MPSFKVACRWVRNEQLPEAVRFTALCWALESYCWLTGQRFHFTYSRMGKHLGFDWNRKPSPAQMNTVCDVLSVERERVKARLLEYQSTRRAEKGTGRRYPSKKAMARIYEPDFFALAE